MSIKTTRKDIIWSYIGYFFNLCSNLIIIPFTLKFITESELGLWYTFLSIGSLVNLLDFGFSSTLIRNITYAWSGAESIRGQGYSEISNKEEKPNHKLFLTVLKACKYISLSVAAFALLILLLVGTRYVTYVARDIAKTEYLYAWYIYSAAIFFNIYYNYWSSVLNGVGAIQQSQKAVIFSRTLQIILSIAGLFLGFGIVALSLAYLVSGFVFRIYCKMSLFKYQDIGRNAINGNIATSHKEVLGVVKAVWHNAKKTGLVSLSSFAVTQSTTLICATFISLGATASYGLSLQIINVIAGISKTFITTVIPMMTNLKISNRKKELYATFSTGMTAFWLTYAAGILAVTVLAIPLLRLIRPNIELSIFMVLFMSFYMFLESNHSLFATFISLSNDIPYVNSAALSGIAVVVFSLLIVNYSKAGIYGLMMVQCIVQLCYNNWKWPCVVMRELGTNPRNMFKKGFSELYKRVMDMLAK